MTHIDKLRNLPTLVKGVYEGEEKNPFFNLLGSNLHGAWVHHTILKKQNLS